MNHRSLHSHPLVTGTLLLTVTGLLSRIIGFFFRIFLSQSIGAEAMGIYQLTFPIHVLTISLTSSAIQTAISRFVAQAAMSGGQAGVSGGQAGRQAGTLAGRRISCNGRCYLAGGLFLSLSLSVFCTVFLYRYSDWIAIRFLEEARCAPLLRVLAFTVPFGAIHGCFNGYFYGLKKTFAPAFSQLVEQVARVASVWLFFEISMEKHQAISLSLVSWGIVVGEAAAIFFCVSFLPRGRAQGSRFAAIRQIFQMSLPLSANRMLVNILQSLEAVMIPGQLRQFGYSASESLSVYGILTGMALPMVLFPSVLTNSVSVLLLPAVAEAQEKRDRQYILDAVRKACFYCILLGLGCTFIFLILGNWMGRTLFGNTLAGTFIVTLGWICPFLYLSTTLHSILNGLGKTTSTFLLNVLGLGVRIGFVLYGIPVAGIKGYLWGILISQGIMAGGALGLILRKDVV